MTLFTLEDLKEAQEQLQLPSHHVNRITNLSSEDLRSVYMKDTAIHAIVYLAIQIRHDKMKEQSP